MQENTSQEAAHNPTPTLSEVIEIAKERQAAESTPTAEPMPTMVGKEEPVPERVKTCCVNNVLPLNILELIRVAPHNETVRTMVLAQIKVPLPVECATYEQIVEWIEYNVKGSVTPPKPVVPNLLINISVSERVSGTCRWSGVNNGRGTVRIPRDKVDEMLCECENLDDIIDKLYGYIDDEGLDSGVDVDLDVDSVEYSSRETTDGDGREITRENSIETIGNRLLEMFPDDETLTAILEDSGY